MALVILKVIQFVAQYIHCLSAFFILYITYLKNLLKALFKQHQHFVKMWYFNHNLSF